MSKITPQPPLPACEGREKVATSHDRRKHSVEIFDRLLKSLQGHGLRPQNRAAG